MATTLTTLAPYANAGPLPQSQRFLLQGAAGDTVAESVTITHLLGSYLPNLTLASQILKLNLSKHLNAVSTVGVWYLVSIPNTTTIVLGRPQFAASAALLEVELMAAHSIIL